MYKSSEWLPNKNVIPVKTKDFNVSRVNFVEEVKDSWESLECCKPLEKSHWKTQVYFILQRQNQKHVSWDLLTVLMK